MKRTWLWGIKWERTRDAAIGRRWGYELECFDIGNWYLWRGEVLVALGGARSPMRARLDAVAALRREMGLLPERCNWRREGPFYLIGDGYRGAVVSRSLQWSTWLVKADRVCGHSGDASTPEAAAEAAEKALGVTP